MYGQELLGGPQGGMMSSWGVGQPLMQSGETLMPMSIPQTAGPMFSAPTSLQTGGGLKGLDFNPMTGVKSFNPVTGPQGSGSGFGLNIGTAQLGLAGLNTIGNLWAAFEARKMAQEQFNFTKSITNTNLANSIASYNTALSDRARSRGFAEGQSQSTIDAYIAANQAKKG